MKERKGGGNPTPGRTLTWRAPVAGLLLPSFIYVARGHPIDTQVDLLAMCGAPSTVTHLGYSIVVLRRSPAPVTSSSSSPCRRAKRTLPRPQLDQEFEGRHRAERVQIPEGAVRSVLGSVGSRRRSTTSTALLNASAFSLRGYVDTLSPLVAMLLLDRSCVIIGKILKYYVPQQWHPSLGYLC